MAPLLTGFHSFFDELLPHFKLVIEDFFLLFCVQMDEDAAAAAAAACF